MAIADERNAWIHRSQPSAISPRPSSRFVARTRRGPWSAARDARERLYTAAHQTVARDHDLRIAAAGWCEAAAHADARRDGRERALIAVNRRDGDRLCVAESNQ